MKKLGQSREKDDLMTTLIANEAYFYSHNINLQGRCAEFRAVKV